MYQLKRCLPALIKTSIGVLHGAVNIMLVGAIASDSAIDPSSKVQLMFQQLDGSCGYHVSIKYPQDRELLCWLDALRHRCNKVDDCYAYCFGRDVGEGIGGGCVHLCNPGMKQHWVPPESTMACVNK